MHRILFARLKYPPSIVSQVLVTMFDVLVRFFEQVLPLLLCLLKRMLIALLRFVEFTISMRFVRHLAAGFRGQRIGPIQNRCGRLPRRH